MRARFRRPATGAAAPESHPAVVAALLATIILVVAACGTPGPTGLPTGAASVPAGSASPAAAAPAATIPNQSPEGSGPASSPGASSPGASLEAPTPETARAAHVPVVTCPTTFGLPGATMGPVPTTMTATVSPEVAARVTFYGNGSTTLLGPKGWHCEAAVGVDGSSSMTITPPGQAAPTGSPSPDLQAVTAYTQGACLGCVATMACGLFPEAWKLFAQPGLACPATLPAGERVTRPIPRAAIFEDPPGIPGTGEPSGGRYRALGLLVFDPGSGAGGSGSDLPSALKITCTLPDAMAQVCDEIVEGVR